MEPNIKAARVHRALFLLYIVVTALMVFAAVMLNSASGSGVFVGYALLTGLLAALHWFVAGGARSGLPWAKGASLVIGCLMLLGFPIGTIIGGYLIYYGAQSWD